MSCLYREHSDYGCMLLQQYTIASLPLSGVHVRYIDSRGRHASAAAVQAKRPPTAYQRHQLSFLTRDIVISCKTLGRHPPDIPAAPATRQNMHTLLRELRRDAIALRLQRKLHEARNHTPLSPELDNVTGNLDLPDSNLAWLGLLLLLFVSALCYIGLFLLVF